MTIIWCIIPEIGMWQTEQTEYQKSWSYATLLLRYNTSFFILGYFLLFTPLTPPPLPTPVRTQKIQIYKKWKKHLEISSFYTCVPNVNLEIQSQALTLMKESRPWLLTIHCANYRPKLALKDTAKEIPKFAECDNFYTNIFYLFNNSGKLKKETKNAVAALNISHYISWKFSVEGS